MGTGGSRGIRTSQDYVRRGGAAARMMLLQAAADEWKVPVAELTCRQRRHHACGDQAGAPRYGEVAAAAAKLTPPDPKTIKLKDPKDWTDRRQAAEAAGHRATSSTAARSTPST